MKKPLLKKIAIGILVTVFFVFWIFRAYNKEAIDHKLCKEGVEVNAHVDQMNVRISGEANIRSWDILYHFYDGGIKFNGEVNDQEDTGIRVGDSLHIVYLRDDPSISKIWTPSTWETTKCGNFSISIFIMHNWVLFGVIIIALLSALLVYAQKE